MYIFIHNLYKMIILINIFLKISEIIEESFFFLHNYQIFLKRFFLDYQKYLKNCDCYVKHFIFITLLFFQFEESYI